MFKALIEFLASKALTPGRLVQLFVVLVFSCSPMAGYAACSNTALEETFSSLWRTEPPTIYDNPGLGTNYPFFGAKAWANVYVYDLNLSSIDDEAIAGYFPSIISEIYQVSSSREPDAILSDPFDLSENFVGKFSFVDLVGLVIISNDNGIRVSIASLGEYESCFFKIRYSHVVPDVSQNGVEQAMLGYSEFAQGIANLIGQ